MKIFTTEQIRRCDRYTIEQEPVASKDLMERAAGVFTDWFLEKIGDQMRPISVCCGQGNNGGDGLVVARLLHHCAFEVRVFILENTGTQSADFQHHLQRLQDFRVPFERLGEASPLPDFPKNSIVIDAIFGSGLKRPVEGFIEKFIRHLNEHTVTRVAIDVPSGMFADQPTQGESVRADFTLSFQFPKLAFFFLENDARMGEWEVRNIGLHPDFIEQEPTPFQLSEASFIQSFLKKRHKHDHKGTFGHALLVAGGYGKVGAAILAAKACLRSGAGLVTIHAPRCAYQILQIAVPEAMVSVDSHEFAVTELPAKTSHYKAIGMGCGIGTNELTFNGLSAFFQRTEQPLILDADALNLLSMHPELLRLVPKNSILTPHPKEFERLFGGTSNGFERLALQRSKAQELDIFIVLKGAFTAIACPDGAYWFNPTGNPGMATGGSGDVLTGILTGLLAQGYSPKEACLLGVYLHGLAGDLAVCELQQEALLASDLTEYIGKAFIHLKS